MSTATGVQEIGMKQALEDGVRDPPLERVIHTDEANSEEVQANLSESKRRKIKPTLIKPTQVLSYTRLPPHQCHKRTGRPTLQYPNAQSVEPPWLE